MAQQVQHGYWLSVRKPQTESVLLAVSGRENVSGWAGFLVDFEQRFFQHYSESYHTEQGVENVLANAVCLRTCLFALKQSNKEGTALP